MQGVYHPQQQASPVAVQLGPLGRVAVDHRPTSTGTTVKSALTPATNAWVLALHTGLA